MRRGRGPAAGRQGDPDGATRDGDVVVRYGGEEFVVIAPATDGDGAVVAAERIRTAVAASGAELVDGRIVPLTVSAGVASLVDETDGRASSGPPTQRSWPPSAPAATGRQPGSAPAARRTRSARLLELGQAALERADREVAAGHGRDRPAVRLVRRS